MASLEDEAWDEVPLQPGKEQHYDDESDDPPYVPPDQKFGLCRRCDVDDDDEDVKEYGSMEERVKKHLLKSNDLGTFGEKVPSYMCSVMEYLCAEVLEVAGNEAKGSLITPNVLMNAIKNDEELAELWKGLPNVEQP